MHVPTIVTQPVAAPLLPRGADWLHDRGYNRLDDRPWLDARRGSVLVIPAANSDFPTPPAGRRGWPWTGDDGTPLAPTATDTAAPKVTVITPSFNQGDFLEEAIRSVVLQDHPNIEFLLLDGGSSDQSLGVVDRYQPWISFWASAPDGGQAAAINSGFERATGDYLCWLNADDVLYQGFCSRRVEEFRARPRVDLIYGDIDTGWSEATRTLLLGEPPRFLAMLRTLRVAVPQQAAMWRRSAVERFGGLDPRWHVVLDREFFLRIIRLGEAEYIPGRCAFFRQHGDAKSVAQATVWVRELPLMYAELFADPDLEPEAQRLERETMAMVHLLCSDILRGAGDLGGATRHLAAAVRWSPGHAITTFVGARISGARRRWVVRRVEAERGAGR